MLYLHPSMLAALTGFLFGFLLSVPVGPGNVTIINEGARRGLLWGLMIGFGAVAMELIYCALAFTGFASLFTGKVMKAIMELTSFVFMLYLGVRFMNARAVETPTVVEERIEGKLHPRSAFATGFVRVMANPGVFLGWVVLAANFISHEWVQPTWEGKFSCVAGVAVGTSVWFCGLSYVVSRGQGKFTEKTLLRMERISGVILLLTAMAQGAHIVWQLVHHTL